MKQIKSWVPVILWAAVIFSLSGIPGLKSGFQCDFILRKIAHVVEYFILAFFLYRAIGRTFKFQGLHLSLSLIAVVFLYAVSDEFHQLFVTGRHGTFRDVLIDQAGVLLFLAVIHLVLRIPSFRSAVSSD